MAEKKISYGCRKFQWLQTTSVSSRKRSVVAAKRFRCSRGHQQWSRRHRQGLCMHQSTSATTKDQVQESRPMSVGTEKTGERCEVLQRCNNIVEGLTRVGEEETGAAKSGEAWTRFGEGRGRRNWAAETGEMWSRLDEVDGGCGGVLWCQRWVGERRRGDG